MRPLPRAGAGHVEGLHDFSFEGPFGSYRPEPASAGLQVYTEICSACHGLKLCADPHARPTRAARTCPKIRCAPMPSSGKCLGPHALFDGEGDFRTANDRTTISRNRS